MNLLLLAAAGAGDARERCDYSAAIDGATQTVDGWPPALRLPESSATVEITAKPVSENYWPRTATLNLGPDGAPTLAENSQAVATLQTELIVGQRVSVLTLQLSRLRDATDETLAALARIPELSKLSAEGRRERAAELRAFRDAPDWPPPAWDLPASDELRVVDVDAPLAEGRVISSLRSVDPDADCVVFELAGVKAPRLLAVSWPHAIAPAAGAEPAPFLVFWRPGVGQNVALGIYAGPGLEPYPFAFDYASYGLLRYLRMRKDAYSNPFQKGVPYQVAASGRPMVTVIPCNAVGPEFGAFMDAATVDMVLREVQREMYRRSGFPEAPEGLGSVSFGSFSSGTLFMAGFVGSAANRRHAFCGEALRELYFFDPPDSSVNECVRQARAWLQSEGNTEARRIRLYSRGTHEAHRQLLGRAPPTAPFVEQSDDGRFTAASLPISCWRASAEAAGFTNLAVGEAGFQDTHQLMPAMMLTHALAKGL